MLSLNENEKIILKKYSSLLNGLSQKPGKLYLTNERVIFEDKKNSSNNIYIKLNEIKRYKELRILLKFKTGFDVILESGVNYCFTLGFNFKSFLVKFEETKGSPLEKETEIKHFWLPNILFGLLMMWFVVIPTISFIGSSFDSMMFKLDPIGFIEDGEFSNDDPTYKSSEMNYPNLHGVWGFKDKNGFSTRLKISMKESEDYSSGKYQVSQWYDGDKKFTGGIYDVKDFILVRGKDMYGDFQVLGCKKELYEKFGLNQESNHTYIFSIHEGGYGKPMLRMETNSWNIWNSMFGKSMIKLNNKVEF